MAKNTLRQRRSTATGAASACALGPCNSSARLAVDLQLRLFDVKLLNAGKHLPFPDIHVFDSLQIVAPSSLASMDERGLSSEKATQTGNAEAPVEQQVHEEEVELREYTSTPPGPTQLTGNLLIDFVNRALDTLLLDGPLEPPSESPVLTHPARELYVQPAACEGSIDYRAFFTDLCMCRVAEQEEVFAPLPTSAPAGRFAHLDPFSREVLGQLSKDEPEVYLPYLHFHEYSPGHRYTYVPMEGLPYTPGWVSAPPQK
ncbi:hypothetical protein Esti_001462 [Eimeria stiedai]